MRYSMVRWVGMVTVAEAVGFGIPVLGMAIASALEFMPWMTWVFVAIFGAGEGALLGLGQAEALHGTDVAVPVGRWVGATAVAAAFAWSLGMLPSTLIDAGVDVDFGSPLVWVVIAVGATTLLLSIPTAQYRILRESQPAARQWIAVNVVAWAVGMMFTFLPSPFIDENTPGVVMALAFVGAGVCMAATVATITGLWWRHQTTSSNPGPLTGTCSSLGA
ncbi:hypothetical protein ACWDTI_24925 [Gordonia sp. NPDC003424]